MHAMFVLLVLATAPQETPTEADGKDPRSFRQINEDLRELIRRDVRARSDPERAEAAFEMTELYRELKRDPRLPTSDTLKEYKAKLWSRLTRIKNDIKKDISRERRRRGQPQPVEIDQDIIDDARLATQSIADNLAILGSSMGGPARVFSAQGAPARGGTAIPDYGPLLVELIESTIAPEFWDTHGGPGTIVYYRPLMALVVRATSDIHYQIGGTLGAVRKAGM